MAVDHLLEVVDCEAVLAGGWAVWHHGYIERVTQDLDIVLAADSVDSLMLAASVSGFEVLAPKPGTLAEANSPRYGHSIGYLAGRSQTGSCIQIGADHDPSSSQDGRKR
jgi:hypothetical protein